jgi:lipopolysaccharide export LptBFGC system permease protein LptF
MESEELLLKLQTLYRSLQEQASQMSISLSKDKVIMDSYKDDNEKLKQYIVAKDNMIWAKDREIENSDVSIKALKNNIQELNFAIKESDARTENLIRLLRDRENEIKSTNSENQQLKTILETLKNENTGEAKRSQAEISQLNSSKGELN